MFFYFPSFTLQADVLLGGTGFIFNTVLIANRFLMHILTVMTNPFTSLFKFVGFEGDDLFKGARSRFHKFYTNSNK